LPEIEHGRLGVTYEQVELHAASSKRQVRGGVEPSLVKTLQDLEMHAVLSPAYKLQSLVNMYVLAELMDGTLLTLRDKFVFSSAPVGSTNTYAQSALVYFAGKLVQDGEVSISDSDFPIPTVRCAFSDRILHSRMPLDPTHVRFKRTCV
jgi:hypothetical protein